MAFLDLADARESLSGSSLGYLEHTALPFSGQFPYAATCDDSFLHVWITARVFGLTNGIIIPFLWFFSNFPIRHEAGDPFLNPAASLLLRLPAPAPPLQTLLKISFATETCREEADLWARHQDLDLQDSGEVISVLLVDACLRVCCSAVQGSGAGKKTRQVSVAISYKNFLAQGRSLYPLSWVAAFSDLRLSPIWDKESSFSTWTPDCDHRLAPGGETHRGAEIPTWCLHPAEALLPHLPSPWLCASEIQLA